MRLSHNISSCLGLCSGSLVANCSSLGNLSGFMQRPLSSSTAETTFASGPKALLVKTNIHARYSTVLCLQMFGHCWPLYDQISESRSVSFQELLLLQHVLSSLDLSNGELLLDVP